MTRENWQHLVDLARKGDNRLFNEAVVDIYEEKIKYTLYKLAASEEQAWELHLRAMLKFWERFVMRKEQLPDSNIEGYIYHIARNAFVDMTRKANNDKERTMAKIDHDTIRKHLKTSLKVESAMLKEEDHIEEQHQQHRHLVALEKAIAGLSDKCRKIIEKNIFEGIKLKALKTALNYGGGYQAIVQQKRRCIKQLARLFFKELSNT